MKIPRKFDHFGLDINLSRNGSKPYKLFLIYSFIQWLMISKESGTVNGLFGEIEFS